MSTEWLIRYTCDFNSAHVATTDGPAPEGWLQLVPAWDGSPRNFDTITCATDWYSAEEPA